MVKAVKTIQSFWRGMVLVSQAQEHLQYLRNKRDKELDEKNKIAKRISSEASSIDLLIDSYLEEGDGSSEPSTQHRPPISVTLQNSNISENERHRFGHPQQPTPATQTKLSFPTVLNSQIMVTY